MKTKHTNTKQSCSLKSPATLASRPRSPAFRSACLLLCLLIYFTVAEFSFAQLDPNSPSAADSQIIPNDANTPKITDDDEIPQKQQQKAQTNISIAANASSQAGKKLPGSSLLIAKSPTTDLGRKLWQVRISTAKSKEENKTRKELREIIELIRSIEIKQQNYATEPVSAVEPPHQTEPNDTTSEPPIREKPQEQQIQTELPSGPLSEKTMQILSEQLQHPEKLKDPFDLAEILFQCGRLKEAAICYQQALARTEPNQADQNQNYAWTLFQIGNCLRNDDPPKAMDFYTKLLEEHPNSPWSDLAKARSKLISWYRRDNPRTLIDENRQPPADHEEANNYMLTTKQQSKTEQSKGG